MVATQTQLRRGTAAQCEAGTPVEGEVWVDLTRDSLRVGDGNRQGGWLMPNFNDIQTQAMQFAVATGTGNAIVLNVTPSPLSYSNGLKVGFRAIANNTGSVTVNVNGLGVVNLQKVLGNVLSTMQAGDIISGAYYEIVFSGSNFQLSTNYQRGLISIGQGDLRTAVGSVSASGTIVVLPGGQYGFAPQVRTSNTTNMAQCLYASKSISFTTRVQLGSITASGSATISPSIRQTGGQGSGTTALGWGSLVGHFPSNNANLGSTIAYAQQRYITASPPYDLGNGDVGGFIFLVQNADGTISSSYIADTPPWAYNGPTDIRATHKCPITDKKFRTVFRKRSVQEIMDGASIEMIQEEITHDIKNADMNLIPHPFDEPKEGQRIILLDPMSDKTERLITLLNNGGGQEVSEIINGGYLKLDESNIRRGCHKSVKACKFGYKNNG